MTKRAGKKKRRAHVAVGPVDTTTEKGPGLARGQTEAGHEAPTVPQSGSQPATLSLPDNGLSVFWPELNDQNLAEINARDGVGPNDPRAIQRAETQKRLWEWRAEIQAVKSHFNIPQALRDRMVYEAAKTMSTPSVPTRERLAALALLKAMDAANRAPGGLPVQVQVTNNVGVNVPASLESAAAGPNVSPQAIVAAMLERGDVLDAIDAYEFKDSGEDYAS